MKMFVLKCPNCAGSLDVENGLDSFYCKYCGHHIMLDGQGDASLKAKIRLKDMEHQETLKDMELAQERYKIDSHTKQKAKEMKWKTTKTVFFCLCVGFFALLIVGYFSSEFDRHQKTVARLEETLAQIQVDISNEEYASALFKANTLYDDSNWSSETEQKWEHIRKSIIKTIEKAQKEK